MVPRPPGRDARRVGSDDDRPISRHDRDVWRPKTPAAGVRSQTEVPRGQFDQDYKTDPNGTTIDQIDKRTKHTSLAAVAIGERLADLEAGHQEVVAVQKDQARDLVDLKVAVGKGDTKLDTIISLNAADRLERNKADEADRTERKEREVAAIASLKEREAAALVVLDRRDERAHDLRKLSVGARAAIATAILGGIAAIVGALAWITHHG